MVYQNIFVKLLMQYYNVLDWLFGGFNSYFVINVWLGGVMVSVLARDTKGRGFDSRPFHFQVTTLGKLFTHTCICHRAV